MAKMPELKAHPLNYKNLYLAGPMTGIAEYNSPEFHSAAEYLRESFRGWVFNPAEQDIESGFDPKGCTGFETKAELADLGFDLRRALGADLEFIATDADAVVVLPGYENSKGVAAELALANALSLPVWYLRKNPDGSWYLRDSLGLGERKVEDKAKALGDKLNESARKLGLLPKEGEPYPKIEFEPSATPMPTRVVNNRFASGAYIPSPEVAKLGELLKAESYSWTGQGRIVTEDELEPSNHDDFIENYTNYKNNGEVRVTSATGGQKGSKQERYDLIPVAPLAHLARTYGKGAEKYDDNNWQKGYDWKLSYAALQRHLNAFWGGEDFDPEIGTPHLANAAWHCFTLMWFMENKPEYDSRAKESN